MRGTQFMALGTLYQAHRGQALVTAAVTASAAR